MVGGVHGGEKAPGFLVESDAALFPAAALIDDLLQEEAGF
jgi:hypothetical protein